MKMKLEAYGRVDLDGTHRAVLETDLPDSEYLVGSSDDGPRFLKIENGGVSCGCLLAETKRGSSNRIYMDRFKQRHLRTKDGESVFVEQIQPPVTDKVTLQVPNDFCERDRSRLIGKPLTNEEKTALYTFTGEPRLFTMVDTGMAGIVVIGPKTTIATSTAQAEKVLLTYRDIGGLAREIRKIRENVEYPLKFPQLSNTLVFRGIPLARGYSCMAPGHWQNPDSESASQRSRREILLLTGSSEAGR